MKLSVTRDNATMTVTTLDDKTPFQLHALQEDMEHAILQAALTKHDGVKAKVAEHLMLNRTTVVEKCRKFGFPLGPSPRARSRRI